MEASYDPIVGLNLSLIFNFQKPIYGNNMKYNVELKYKSLLLVGEKVSCISNRSTQKICGRSDKCLIDRRCKPLI